jgi:hypothetical protein
VFSTLEACGLQIVRWATAMAVNPLAYFQLVVKTYARECAEAVREAEHAVLSQRYSTLQNRCHSALCTPYERFMTCKHCCVHPPACKLHSACLSFLMMFGVARGFDDWCLGALLRIL